MPPAKYLVLDCEMTGFDPFRHGLIECAGAVLDANLAIITTFTHDICPPADIEIDPEALRVNGFTHERIALGIPYADFCHRFRDFVREYFPLDKPIIIGQFYAADYAFLASVFDRARDGRFFRENFLGNHLIDTKAVAHFFNLIAVQKGESLPFPTTSLSAQGGLKDRFGLMGYASHTALGDVMATRDVLAKMAEWARSHP